MKLTHVSRMNAPRRPYKIGVLAALCATALVCGCQAQPGPAPTINSGDNSSSKTDIQKQSKRITIAVSNFGTGFNPHLITDNTPLVQHIASLVLPSAFVEQDSSTMTLNTDLLTSAEVINSGSSQSSSQASSEASETAAPSASANHPFTVRYTISPNAQWSDGTPITGSDFEYLWKEMIIQPGVVDPAGYETISSVSVTNGGKQVDVQFRQAFPGWKSLFSNLLPSHLFRSSGNFQTILNDTIPVSGNKFAVESVDSSRGVVSLSRNDRYWGSELARADRIVLESQNSATANAEMLRNGQMQGASIRPSATSTLTFQGIPGAQVQTHEANRFLMLAMNTASTEVADPSTRIHLLSTINRDTISKIASGRTDEHAPTDNTIISGTTVASQGQSSVSISKPLRIVADQGDDMAVSAARAIADEWNSAGIPAKVYTADPADIMTSILPSGLADAYVGWQSGQDSISQLASQFQCSTSARGASAPSDSIKNMFSQSQSSAVQTTSAKPNSTSTESASAGDEESKTSAVEDSSAEPSTTRSEEVMSSQSSSPASGSSSESATSTPLRARTANISGICDSELDSMAKAVLTGETQLTTAAEQMNARSDQLGLTLSLLQDSETGVSMPTLIAPRINNEVPWGPRSGFFDTAWEWSLASSASTSDDSQLQ